MFNPSRLIAAALIAGSDEAARVVSASMSAIGVAVASLTQALGVPLHPRMAAARLADPLLEATRLRHRERLQERLQTRLTARRLDRAARFV
jgi:hypothetical protein